MLYEMGDRPGRWKELNEETQEWIARLNLPELRALIRLSHLPEKELTRLETMLRMDDEKWEAGLKLASRSATWTRITKRFPSLVLLVAGLLTASNVIWTYAKPWLSTLLSGGKP